MLSAQARRHSCTYGANSRQERKDWGIRAMNQPLPSLRSSVRNIHISQSLCCLALTHLLLDDKASSDITFWLESTHWTYLFCLPCLSRGRNPSTLRGTTGIPTARGTPRHPSPSCLWSRAAHQGNSSEQHLLWSYLFGRWLGTPTTTRPPQKYCVQSLCLSSHSCIPGRT